MSRGVTILAVKDSVYAKYAYNLAMTVKLSSREKVQVIFDKETVGSLSDLKKNKAFDHITVLDENYGSMSPGMLKTEIYNLTCFDKTLFIDADSLLFPYYNISNLMDELQGLWYQPVNMDSFSKEDRDSVFMFGCKVGPVVDEYSESKGERIYRVNSCVFYFEKSDEIKPFFDTVSKVYREISLGNSITHKINSWKGGMVPDEVAFCIANYVVGFEPAWTDWNPFITSGPSVESLNYMNSPVEMIDKLGHSVLNEDNPSEVFLYNYTCLLYKIKYQEEFYEWKGK